jgi:DNA-binding response OmpR family regulator
MIVMAATIPDAPVLIVEDDATAAEIFGLSLREAGYHVQLVGDADAALLFVAHDLPAVMIIDIQLPTFDGLELLRRLRAQPLLAAIPVAIVTGNYFLDDDVINGFVELGAQVFFKPIWHEDLLQIVGNLLSGTKH